MHSFVFFRNSIKGIGKKFLIVLTCIMLVVAPNLKNSKAFFLVDDLTAGAVIAGLCLIGGVALTVPAVKEGAGELLTNAVNSYTDFYGGVISDGYEKVKEICTDVYNTGTVLASDFNDWLHGWLGNFINDWLLPTYPLEGNPNAPIFSFVDNFSFNNDMLVYDSSGKVVENLHDNWLYDVIWFYSPNLINYYHLIDYPSNGDLSSVDVVKFVLTSSGINLYYLYSGSSEFTRIKWSIRPTPSYTLPLSVPLCLTGLANYMFEFADGTTAFYNNDTGKWSRDMEGQLELDPDIFNKDLLGDIDIAPPYVDKLLDNTMDYTNTWVLGQDATFDNVGDLTFPGTIDIPRDYTDEYVNSEDYPLIIEGDYPIVDDIPKDDVITQYPDYPITISPPTDYVADWTSVFPFCIPYDIFIFFDLLSATPKAPNFSWNYNIIGVKGTININLDKFDDAARICRNMMDLLFIVGLAMVTRSHLIKA